MENPITIAIKRFGRYLFSYALAILLEALVKWLSGIQFPPLIAPLIAGIISAIGKYIRETLKLRVPF